MITQLCKFTNDHWIACLKWMSFTVRKLNLNKTALKTGFPGKTILFPKLVLNFLTIIFNILSLDNQYYIQDLFMEIQKLNVSPKHSRWTQQSSISNIMAIRERRGPSSVPSVFLAAFQEGGWRELCPGWSSLSLINQLCRKAAPPTSCPAWSWYWPSFGEQETCPLATTKLPVTATWNFWKRRPGETWTSLMRMAWRPHSWLPTTGTWKPWR